MVKRKIGLDTSFFVRLLAGKEKAISVYEKIINGEEKAVVSVVVFELRRLVLKGIIDREAYNLLENSLKKLFEIAPVDLEIAIEASSVSHGTGLHASDALIYILILQVKGLKFWREIKLLYYSLYPFRYRRDVSKFFFRLFPDVQYV